MAEAVLTALLRAAAAASVTILLVLLARRPVRRAFGAEVASSLWLGPPLAFAASLLPTPFGVAGGFGAAPRIPSEMAAWLLTIWGLGAAAMAALLAIAQAAFLRRARAGAAGPAVVGVVCPRILMPPDDGRYTALERRVMRAHERMHIQRRDPQGRAWIAFGRCLLWWNPLAHLAGALAVLDQELACDAAVLRLSPWARPLYARTLLRSQVPQGWLPFGALWAARRHPLETRLASLGGFRRGDGAAGPALLAVGLAAIALGAWTVQPRSGPTVTLLQQRVLAGMAQNTPVMSVALISWAPAPGR